MKIGDKVLITNPGLNYPNYQSIFSKMGVIKSSNYCRYKDINIIYEIYDIQPHDNNPLTLLYQIGNGDKQFIFNGEGLLLHIECDRMTKWSLEKLKKFKTL